MAVSFEQPFLSLQDSATYGHGELQEDNHKQVEEESARFSPEIRHEVEDQV
jgi:hypothetical protein